MKTKVSIFNLRDESPMIPHKIYDEISSVTVEQNITKLFMWIGKEEKLVAIIPNSCHIQIQYINDKT